MSIEMYPLNNITSIYWHVIYFYTVLTFLLLSYYRTEYENVLTHNANILQKTVSLVTALSMIPTHKNTGDKLLKLL
jgi:hypothetical protein